MRPKRIKVHPIGYKKRSAVSIADHYGQTIDHVQTVNMPNGQIRVIKHYKVFALGGCLS